MQIRRNTKSFKTILEIVSSVYSRPDRQSLIRLYITKLGHSISQRIPVHGTQSEAEFFYDLNFQAVLNNLKSSGHQIYQSDEEPGIYFFRSNLGQNWDETPFEFDDTVKKEFASLPELPATRAKGKTQEFVLPDPSMESDGGERRKLKKEVAPKKAASADRQTVMTVSRSEQPVQPRYDLKREVHFTELDKIVFRQAKLSKKDVLDYYDKAAEYLLPGLKDRPLQVRIQADSGPNSPYINIESVPKKGFQEIPAWIQKADVYGDNIPTFICNDKDHLMQYAELGIVEFDPCLFRRKAPGLPDHCVIKIESGSEFSKAVEVTLHAHEILEGLKLYSLVKTDGISGLHLYIPLDSKSDFDASRIVGESICRLIRLKVPNLVTIKGIDEYSYGLVSLDPQINSESGGVVTPYSFVAGSPALIAAPLDWDEVDEELRLDQFTHDAILERLKKKGDLLEGISKKGASASEVGEMLEERYGFLW